MRKLLALLLTFALAAPCFAALDAKAKRGSAIGLGSPGRTWLAEPYAAQSEAGRLSLVGLAATDAGIEDVNSYLLLSLPLQDSAASTAVVAATGQSQTLTSAGNTADVDTTGPGGSYTSALQLDGTNDYITHAMLANWLTDSATVAWWEKLDAATPATAQAGIGHLGAHYAILTNGASHLPFSDGLGYLAHFRQTADTTVSRVNSITMPAGVTRTNWHMVVVVTQPGANGWKLYYYDPSDNELALVSQQTGITGVYYDADAWFIGRSSTTTTQYHFDGAICGYRIYSRALDSDDILALAALGDPSGAAGSIFGGSKIFRAGVIR